MVFGKYMSSNLKKHFEYSLLIFLLKSTSYCLFIDDTDQLSLINVKTKSINKLKVIKKNKLNLKDFEFRIPNPIWFDGFTYQLESNLDKFKEPIAFAYRNENDIYVCIWKNFK